MSLLPLSWTPRQVPTAPRPSHPTRPSAGTDSPGLGDTAGICPHFSLVVASLSSSFNAWHWNHALTRAGAQGGIGVHRQTGQCGRSPSAGGAVPALQVCRERCRQDARPLTPSPPCLARQLVEKFAVALQDIPQVHPGEAVFLPQRHPPPCFLDASGLRPHSALEELFLK